MAAKKTKPTGADFKADLLYGIKAMRESILAEVLALPPGAHEVIFLGTWSVMDLLAHFSGWDYANLQAAQDILDGLLPEFYEHFDRDWHTYNAALVEKYKQPTLRKQVALARQSQAQLLDEMRKLSEEDIKRDTGVRARGIKVTIARLLQAELEDETTHFEQLYEFRKSL